MMTVKTSVAEAVASHLESKLNLHNIGVIEALIQVGRYAIPDSVQVVLATPDEAGILTLSLCRFADLATELKSRYR